MGYGTRREEGDSGLRAGLWGAPSTGLSFPRSEKQARSPRLRSAGGRRREPGAPAAPPPAPLLSGSDAKAAAPDLGTRGLQDSSRLSSPRPSARGPRCSSYDHRGTRAATTDRNNSQEMPHSTNKELILGIMAGTAGISLIFLWYHKVRKPRTTVTFPKFFSLGKKFGSLTLQDESHSEQGPSTLFQRRQLQILEKLNELLTNMEELKEEIRCLKEAIPKLEEYIQDELGGKVTVHKMSPQHRARKKKVTTVQSSATSNSSEEAESEGGYITANTDTEDQSFPVPKAFNTHIEELKLDVLLQKVDHLRMNEADKMESFELLCDHKEKFSEEIEFLWRLARAYGDMCDLSTNRQEKKHYANIGKTLGERAITRAPMNGHCHLWYAVLCGHVSEFEGLQNKISCGHLFKEHLDIAIQLLPEEPLLYYLKGRYCYTVSKLSWIEKKMAATLFGEIPSSTIHEALLNFLKAEELQPGYSVSNYMYVAKCYVDLEESQDASKFCNLALLLPIVTKEDKDAHKEVKKIICSLKR